MVYTGTGSYEHFTHYKCKFCTTCAMGSASATLALSPSVLTQLALALKVRGADLHFKCFALKVLGTKYTGT